MSRRRKRDANVIDEVHSEGESEDGGVRRRQESFTDTENEDLEVSEYESAGEEDQHSSGDEYDQEETVQEEAEDGTGSNREQINTQDEELKREDNVEETRRESGDGKSDNEQLKTEVSENTGTENEDKEKEEDPAFIPTKGAFFQHDLRTDGQSKGRAKKLWDKGDAVKWSHDMFIMEEQMPKSRDTLISEYGYDIRAIADGVSPPQDARRPRGRGRGYRGRRSHPQTRRGVDSRRTFNQYRESNTDYHEGYPTLERNRQSNYIHKSKSYWKSDHKRSSPSSTNSPVQNQAPLGGQIPENNAESPTNSDVSETKEVQSTSNEIKNEERFSDILQVINNREQVSTENQSSPKTAFSNSRKKEGSTKTSFSNYQESHKPRRYSSLRQRNMNSPVERQMQNSPRTSQTRYSNFAKPQQPDLPTTFTNNSQGQQIQTDTVKTQVIPEEILSAPHTSQQHTTVPQATPTSQPPPQTGSYPDPPPTSLGAPLDASPVPMPPLGFGYNSMLNPSYLAAFDHRMMQMMSQQMSQMNLDQLQQQPAMQQQLDSSNSNANAATIAPPHMQMNPLVPPVSQGSLGSILRAPPPPLNPPTYFSGPVGMNLGMQQQPFPYPPNLMAQQVGGVTYFNTSSPPTLPPAPNQQGSPRRHNAAIPIMAPLGFGTGMLE